MHASDGLTLCVSFHAHIHALPVTAAVVAEVRKAPQRRIDNLLTGLYDAAAQLEMHGRIVQDLQRRYSKLYWRAKRQEFSVAASGGGLAAGLAALTHYGLLAVPFSLTGSIATVTILATTGMTWYHGRQMEEWERQACGDVAELAAAFQRTHARQVSEGDEYTAALWQRIRTPLQRALHPETGGLSALATVTDADLQSLRKIMHQDLPALRRKVAPLYYGKEEEHSGGGPVEEAK